MKKIILKSVSFVIAVCILVTVFNFSVSAKAEDNIPAVDKSLNSADGYTGDYYRQYMVDLFDKGILKSNSQEVKIEKSEKFKGIIISGTKSAMSSAKIDVDKIFDFNDGSVGRFSIDALAKKGSKAEIAFYLDNDNAPFACVSLHKQKKKNDWQFQKEITVDLSEKNLTGKHTISFSISSLSGDDVFIRSVEFVKESVPTVYFNIDESEGSVSQMNASPDHSDECYGNIEIKVPAGYKSVDTGKELTGGKYELEYVRGRGNSTWYPDKKPYKIKLDKKADLLGLGKNKHWVLLANYFDNSLLRNKITYYIAEQLGMEYTPQSEPVDVVMNGEYYGSYFLCEQIRVGETRVNIDDLEESEETKNSTDPEIISGGYLLSLFPYDDEDGVTIKTKRDEVFLLENPKFEDGINQTQYNYISNYLQKVEDAMYGKDFKSDDGISYTDLLDLKSAVYYYWIQEFSMNGDGYGSTSSYLYKKRNGKLFYGPLWDFDFVAWGSTEYDELMTDGWIHQSSDVWISRLFEDEKFVSLLKSTWPIIKEQMQKAVADGGQLDKYYQNLKSSASYNFEKWGMTDFDFYVDESEENQKKSLSYKEEIDRLKTWIKNRINWVDKNVGRIVTPVPCKVKFVAQGKTILETTEYTGKYIEEFPKAPSKKGYVFSGWKTSYKLTFDEYLKAFNLTEEDIAEQFDKEEIKNLKANGYKYDGPFNSYDPIPCSLTIQAQYVNVKKIKAPQKIFFSRKEYCGYKDMEDISLIYDVTPFDAFAGNLEWSSSNKKVAEVKDGIVTLKSEGKAVITATAFNGVKAQCTVRVVNDEEDYWEYVYLKKNSMKMQLNSYAAMPLVYEGMFYSDCSFQSLNDSVVEVGAAGVLHAVGKGSTTIIIFGGESEYGELMTLDVTVDDKNEVKKGKTYTVKGLKYLVTSNKGKNLTVKCVGADKNVKKVKIPSTVTIKKKKFAVTEIKSKAFYKNKKITSVSIGNNVKFIGSKAFYSCKKLSKVSVGKKAQIIYSKAFANNKKLKSITLKAKNIKIYGDTFKAIKKNAKIKVPKNNKKYYKLILKKYKIV